MQQAISSTIEYLKYGELIKRKFVVPVPLRLHAASNFDDPWLVPLPRQGKSALFETRGNGNFRGSKILRSRVEGLNDAQAENLIVQALMARSDCNHNGGASAIGAAETCDVDHRERWAVNRGSPK